MGFWNPRVFCPKCGAKIHTRSEAVGLRKTGGVCPNCGVGLSGKVTWDNKAELRDVIIAGNDQSTASADQLTQLGRLRKEGVLTRSEFEAAKKRVLTADESDEAKQRYQVVITRVPEVGKWELRKVVWRWTRSARLTPPVIVNGSPMSMASAEGLQRALEERGATAELRRVS